MELQPAGSLGSQLSRVGSSEVCDGGMERSMSSQHHSSGMGSLEVWDRGMERSISSHHHSSGSDGDSGGSRQQRERGVSARPQPLVMPPSGPRRNGLGVEDEEQGIMRADYNRANGGASLHITLLAAGFIIGPCGTTIREIGKQTGADIRSWTVGPGRAPRPCRIFMIEGRRRAVGQALEILCDAVERYKQLCEGAYCGQYVSKHQVVRGITFTYQPPPRSVVPYAAALEGQYQARPDASIPVTKIDKLLLRGRRALAPASRAASAPLHLLHEAADAAAATVASGPRGHQRGPPAMLQRCGSPHMPGRAGGDAYGYAPRPMRASLQQALSMEVGGYPYDSHAAAATVPPPPQTAFAQAGSERGGGAGGVDLATLHALLAATKQLASPQQPGSSTLDDAYAQQVNAPYGTDAYTHVSAPPSDGLSTLKVAQAQQAQLGSAFSAFSAFAANVEGPSFGALAALAPEGAEQAASFESPFGAGAASPFAGVPPAAVPYSAPTLAPSDEPLHGGDAVAAGERPWGGSREAARGYLFNRSLSAPADDAALRSAIEQSKETDSGSADEKLQLSEHTAWAAEGDSMASRMAHLGLGAPTRIASDDSQVNTSWGLPGLMGGGNGATWPWLQAAHGAGPAGGDGRRGAGASVW